MRSRAILLALVLAGCAPRQTVPPDVPRIRCLALAHLPDSPYWLYACTFNGELPDDPPTPGDVGTALRGAS